MVKTTRLSSLLLSALLCRSVVLAAAAEVDFRLWGPQALNIQRLDELYGAGRDAASAETVIGLGESQQTPLMARPHPQFEPHWFKQPLDHFSNSSETFKQRYWINTRHYKPRPGAPVIVIDGGETSGEDRLPFLDTGIADILANATGGIGVILEHRSVTTSTYSRIFLTEWQVLR